MGEVVDMKGNAVTNLFCGNITYNSTDISWFMNRKKISQTAWEMDHLHFELLKSFNAKYLRIYHKLKTIMI